MTSSAVESSRNDALFRGSQGVVLGSDRFKAKIGARIGQQLALKGRGNRRRTRRREINDTDPIDPPGIAGTGKSLSFVSGYMKNILLLSVLLSAPTGALAQDCGSVLANELLQRNAKDQAARAALTSTPTSKDLRDAVLHIDKENTSFMRQVLSECGWPKKSIVGPEAAKAAWRLTQHADMDPEYQILASRQLKYAVFEKEAERSFPGPSPIE